MGQFSVHRNPAPEDGEPAPYLLVVQHDLLADLATVVVAPLIDDRVFGTPARILNPVFVVEDRRVVLSIAELAGVSRNTLGEKVTTLEPEREAILSALDLLFTGI